MSETSQGHGWWLASDGKWYPPEAWTGHPPQSGQPPSTAAGYPVGYQSEDRPDGFPVSHPSQGYPPSYPSQAYPSQAYPSQGNPSQGYPSAGYPPQGASWSTPPPTNGLAIASLVCACAGIIPFLFGLPLVLGVIFGFVSRSQIRNARGAQGGAGVALAGIIVSFSILGLFILAIVLVAILDPSTHSGSAPGL
jgi:Domain of unknown function (DUF4190)